MISAAIDIGTNSVLLLVAKFPPLRVIRDEARITGLGRGLQKTFHPESKKRTVAALQEYARSCRKAQVGKVFCVGTAAFRKASDGPAFMGEIQNRFGWETRILTEDDEARLSFLSVERDFGDRYPLLVALDIGGGSTEIVSKAGGVSLELGTVALTEKFLRHDPPSENEIAKVISAIDRTLSPLPLSPPLLNKERGTGGEVSLVGLAGTVTTLSAINQRMKKWDPKKIQGSTFTLSELEKMISLLRRTTNEERRAIPGMVPGREDTLLAGALILRAVMNKLGSNRVIVSDRGLRYGLFYQEFS